MTQERRIYKRINVSVPINYTTLEAPQKTIGNTVCKDISRGGIKIALDKFYPHKMKFLIKVNLENIHKVVESIAETVWSMNEPYSNRYCSGLRFTDINREHQDILKQYIDVQSMAG